MVVATHCFHLQYTAKGTFFYSQDGYTEKHTASNINVDQIPFKEEDSMFLRNFGAHLQCSA